MSAFTLYIPMSGSDEKMTTSATASASAAAPAGTIGVRLHAETGSHHVAFDGSTATDSNLILGAGSTEYLKASPGMVLSVRTTSGAGELSVSWLRNPA